MIASTTEATGQDALVVPADEARFNEQDKTMEAKEASSSDGSKSEESESTDASVGADPTVGADSHNPKAGTWSFVYAQLARQLEYYFSEKNLSKDTYVQTLRQLNDGCVPVSILANFAMVKRLVTSLAFVIDEEGRLAAVEEAARNHSERLTVCLIDSKTGKQVTDKDATESSHRILAVGTVDGNPLVLDSSIAQPSPIIKTIVLRDVVDGVTPEEIHELFTYEGFPPVTCIQPDVANCWFVTLDTEDRNDILQVLLSLRSMTLREHAVHARIKSTVAKAVVDSAPVMPWVPPVPEVGGEPAKAKKKKTRGKKKKIGSNSSAASNRKAKKEQAKRTPPPPPTLGEDNFPTLQDKTVEFDTAQVDAQKSQPRRGSNCSAEEDYEDEEERTGKLDDLDDDKDERKSLKAMSDGASTATTTSSSLESVPKKTFPTVGYAAALMGKSTSTGNLEVQAGIKTSTTTKVEAKSDVAKVPEDQPVTTTLAPKSDTWGGRRSFADILRDAQDTPATSSS